MKTPSAAWPLLLLPLMLIMSGCDLIEKDKGTSPAPEAPAGRPAGGPGRGMTGPQGSGQEIKIEYATENGILYLVKGVPMKTLTPKVKGGSGPFLYNPFPPAGIGIDPSTGAISGQPLETKEDATVTIGIGHLDPQTSTTVVFRIDEPTAGRLTSGPMHSCAIINPVARGAHQHLICWGLNSDGQLGTGTTERYHDRPSFVEGLTDGIQDVAAGAAHTCAIVKGEVWCWGQNTFGQAGVSASRSESTPKKVAGTEGATALVAGVAHTCAIVKGVAKCWGSSEQGQLGGKASQTCADNKPCSSSPIDVPGLEGGVKAVAAGDFHTCAINKDDRVLCWGSNARGEMGSGSKDNTPHAVAEVKLQVVSKEKKAPKKREPGEKEDEELTEEAAKPVDLKASLLAAGGAQSCVLAGSDDDKRVFCWGKDEREEKETFVGPTDIDSDRILPDISSLAVGPHRACALGEGHMYCWGRNEEAEMGGRAKPRTLVAEPLEINATPFDVVAASLGERHTCVSVRRGSSFGVQCWGRNDLGQFGNGQLKGAGSDRSSEITVEPQWVSPWQLFRQ